MNGEVFVNTEVLNCKTLKILAPYREKIVSCIYVCLVIRCTKTNSAACFIEEIVKLFSHGTGYTGLPPMTLRVRDTDSQPRLPPSPHMEGGVFGYESRPIPAHTRRTSLWMDGRGK